MRRTDTASCKRRIHTSWRSVLILLDVELVVILLGDLVRFKRDFRVGVFLDHGWAATSVALSKVAKLVSHVIAGQDLVVRDVVLVLGLELAFAHGETALVVTVIRVEVAFASGHCSHCLFNQNSNF